MPRLQVERWPVCMARDFVLVWELGDARTGKCFSPKIKKAPTAIILQLSSPAEEIITKAKNSVHHRVPETIQAGVNDPYSEAAIPDMGVNVSTLIPRLNAFERALRAGALAIS